MREIVLDTETTGMEPADGDKIVELGCLEIINGVPTGRTLHHYINPERDIPAGATAVHGITSEFVRGKPIFSQIYTEFLDFIGEDATLVIHNAPFDLKFLNHELKKVGHKGLQGRKIVDRVLMARQKYPGSPASLDALCRRFNIDLSSRTLHGALLDSQLLAEVYLEMLGGRQHGLGLQASSPLQAAQDAAGPVSAQAVRSKKERVPRPHAPTDEEKTAFEALLAKLKNPLWKESA